MSLKVYHFFIVLYYSDKKYSICMATFFCYYGSCHPIKNNFPLLFANAVAKVLICKKLPIVYFL